MGFILVALLFFVSVVLLYRQRECPYQRSPSNRLNSTWDEDVIRVRVNRLAGILLYVMTSYTQKITLSKLDGTSSETCIQTKCHFYIWFKRKTEKFKWHFICSFR